MASNTVRSAFVAILCMAFVLCVQAEDECDCVCGVSRNNRIIGGTRAGKTEFPWLVAMFRRGYYFCGGSLITERHVLTAAHCFHKVNQSDVTIGLGAYDLDDKTEMYPRRTIKKVTTHPDFHIDINYDSDVAIIELNMPVTFGTWNLGTACLPSETYREYDGEFATVVGRGRTNEKGGLSAIPLKVDVPLMSMKACRNTSLQPRKVTDNMLCAGFPDGEKDACRGDSGGPLHLRTLNSTMTTSELVGIVSWGSGCGRHDLPGVYTRLQKFVPWIREQIAGACECARL